MEIQVASRHYDAARRLGVRAYAANVSKGQTGYLPFLEGVLANVDIVSEIDLGIIEIPLKKIIGTYTYSRSVSFASNFMPLMHSKTEFEQKWIALCAAHLNEGIRDPIKVYEYLNWFYAVEGNKRVSVLKYFDAYSIPGKVIRLIPKKDDSSRDIKIYYEFLEFNKKTGINCIWFSRENRFGKLLKYLEKYRPKGLLHENKYKHFTSSVYLPFRKMYHELGGQKLPITTGDAILEYINVYGIPSEMAEEKLRLRLRAFMTELERFAGNEQVDIQTEPLADRDSRIISTITTLVKPKKKLRVAFAYAKTIKESNWSCSHDWGRMHVEKQMKEQVSTSYIESVPENLQAYKYLKELAEQGNDVIFATSPAFINATLKAALEFPNIKFFNCSQTHSFKHVNTYFGRIYEPRFLAGVIAGAVTRSDVLGYVGTFPIPEVISGINSFALGARMVNPHVKVRVAWTDEWDSQEKSGCAGVQLIESGADIISHHNTLGNREFCREFGVYSMVCNVDEKNCIPKDYLAAPVWNWGIFYERIITSILNDTWKSITDIFGSSSRLINFWWGMDSGIVDLFYSTRLVPKETQKLVNFIKKMIESNAFHPFTGPVYDQKGNLKIERDEFATHDQVLSMDWFVDAVESELPEFDRKNFISGELTEFMELDG